MLRSLALCCLLFITLAAKSQLITSPDQKVQVTFYLAAGKPVYTITYQGKVVLKQSNLGVEMGNINLYSNINLLKVSPVEVVKDSYSMVNAKKENITYTANKRIFTLSDQQGHPLSIIFQVSNDGVGFRYQFEGKAKDSLTITKEHTTYHFSTNSTAWLQPKAEAQTGWEHTNPSYEENYQQNIKVGSPSKTGWVYPALFKTNQTWIAITEAGMDGKYCGTVLKNEAGSPVYQIGFPDPREVFTGKGLHPSARGTWYSPWRIITLGSLKTITESTLGTDLASPAIKLKDPSFIKPGKSSWSWIMSKDDAIVYDEQKKYIDYAAQMNWSYCLIDVNWDTKIGYDKIAELSAYASTKKVGLLLWYNSAGSWNTVPYHPKGKLLTHQSRVEEFAKLKQMGIKGIKVDFFNGDGQSMIEYYTAILADAAEYNLLVNFHGATLPRGWARTYPHLMTTEAVKGFEMITFEQSAADVEANHATMLPFTRNLFDPMDFTPMNLYQIPTKVVRKTTGGFELATSVVFLSGIQHYAESPEGMSHIPAYVQEYLRTLPDHWQDVKFIDGEPGKFIVIARKSGDQWYLAGMNNGAAKTLNLDLSVFNKKQATLFNDSANGKDFNQQKINILPKGKTLIKMQPNGGFVLVLE